MIITEIVITKQDGSLVIARSMDTRDGGKIVATLEDGKTVDLELGDVTSIQKRDRSIPAPDSDVNDPTFEPQTDPRAKTWASPHSPDHPDNQGKSASPPPTEPHPLDRAAGEEPKAPLPPSDLGPKGGLGTRNSKSGV